MELSRKEVIKISGEPVDDWILLAREDAKELRMHYYGDGAAEYLEKIDRLENPAEFDLRKRFLISNKFLCENLVRPMDNIFSAKGGTIEINLPLDSTKEIFKRQLQDVKGGRSDKEYLKHIWKDKFITDPAGLMFLEAKKDGSKCYLTQKPIEVIRKMKLHGVHPEYVMFEADVHIKTIEKDENGNDKDNGYSLHWFVDDLNYYRVKVWADSDKTPEILEIKPNTHKYVPGVTNSTILDTNRNIPVSPIWKQTELLTKYLRNGSIKEVTIGKHGYPIFWTYQSNTEICRSCWGAGFNIDRDDPQERRNKCGNCAGEGVVYKKDVSDAVILKPPTSKDSPVLSKVSGYESPPIEAWQEQRTEQDWTWNLIYYSLWGTTVEKGENETATGRFIDIQPVNNRLNDLQDSKEVIHTWIIKMFADFYVPLSFRGVSVSGGRRFILETPDQIWKKYTLGKTDGISEERLDSILQEYVEAEYQSNDLLRDYHLKVNTIDPLPHTALLELQGLMVPEIHKKRKVYLNEWLNTKMKVEVIERKYDDLIKDLDNYIKTQDNGTSETSEG